MGKLKPSLKSHVTSSRHMIYCIYSHAITLNNVMMTDAWEQSWKRDRKIKYFLSAEAIYSNCPYGWFTATTMKSNFQHGRRKNAFLSWQRQPPQIVEMVNDREDVGPVGLSLQWPLSLSQSPPPLKWNETWRFCLNVGQRTCKPRHAVEGSKAILIPCCSHIPTLSPLVYLSLRNTWNSLILLALSSLH